MPAPPVNPRELEAVRSFPSLVRERVTEQLRVLFQEKHLYQSVVVPIGSVPMAGDDRPDLRAEVRRVKNLVQGRWYPLDPQNRRLHYIALERNAEYRAEYFYFQPPDVKLFCSSPCGRVEAFNLVSAEDFLSREEVRQEPYKDGADIIQVFAFSFQCQSCKGAPEILLVRRQGPKITNAGRAPIEHVSVPSDIPKEVRKFFSGAVVAHQSGQTLAGLFLLRTLIEQFARAVTGAKAENADQVLDAYMGSLPGDFKERFPSMRLLYSDLSVDIHAAAGSPDLFDRAKTEIIEHFETRRVFKLKATTEAT